MLGPPLAGLADRTGHRRVASLACLPVAVFGVTLVLGLPRLVVYAYPMTAADLREWIKSFSAGGWEWSETNDWVSAKQLRLAPPLGHLYAYLLATNFLVPTQIPVPPTASELSYGAA